jgi:predicted nucleotidyltransferase
MARPTADQPRQDLLTQERSRILSLISERGGRNVRVFGSVARGEDDSLSDIDLLIELPAGETVGGELLTVLGLSEELSQLLGARVDVATVRTLRDEVRQSAIAEAVLL